MENMFMPFLKQNLLKNAEHWKACAEEWLKRTEYDEYTRKLEYDEYMEWSNQNLEKAKAAPVKITLEFDDGTTLVIGNSSVNKKSQDSWNNHIDRQGGSFTDQEILESYTWK